MNRWDSERVSSHEEWACLHLQDLPTSMSRSPGPISFPISSTIFPHCCLYTMHLFMELIELTFSCWLLPCLSISVFPLITYFYRFYTFPLMPRFITPMWSLANTVKFFTFLSGSILRTHLCDIWYHFDLGWPTLRQTSHRLIWPVTDPITGIFRGRELYSVNTIKNSLHGTFLRIIKWHIAIY